MLKSRICPRCEGYLVLDKDRYGWFLSCIQCGYECTLGGLREGPALVAGVGSPMPPATVALAARPS